MAIAKMSVTELEKFLHDEFPQAFQGGDISIESADGESCLLRHRYSDQMLRPGGTISGPTLMALADFAMYVVLLSACLLYTSPAGCYLQTWLSADRLACGKPLEVVRPRRAQGLMLPRSAFPRARRKRPGWGKRKPAATGIS